MYTTIEVESFQRRSGDPYTIAFVYPKHDEPCVIKGMYTKVTEHIDKLSPALVNLTFWRYGQHRNLWHFFGHIGYVSKQTTGKYRIRIYKDDTPVKTLMLKRMPHRWIPDFD